MEHHEVQPLFNVALAALDRPSLKEVKELIRTELPEPSAGQREMASLLYEKLKLGRPKSKNDVLLCYWGLVSSGLRSPEPAKLRLAQMLWPILKQEGVRKGLFSR